MKKEEVLTILHTLNESHEPWVRQGQILIDGLNLDNAEPPVRCTDCEFGVWFYAQASSLNKFSWYEDLKQSHEALHKSYSVLYNESMRMYNPKTHTELLERFEELENNATKLKDAVEITINDLNNLTDKEFNEILVDSEDKQDKGGEALIEPDDSEKSLVETKESSDISAGESIEPEVSTLEELLEEQTEVNNDAATQIEQTVEVMTSEPKPFHVMNASEQRSYLKQQDLKQIIQEKRLAASELDQINKRRELTQQGITQLEQYYLLKQQEMESHRTECDEKETHTLETQNYKRQELLELEKLHEHKIKELDQLDKVDLKLEEQKRDSEIQENKTLKHIKEQKTLRLDDLDKIQGHLELRNNDLKKLKEQVKLVEQDILELQEQTSKKQDEIKSLEQDEAQTKNELEKAYLKKIEINKHKIEVQKEKERELGLVEQQQQLRKNELEEVDQELRNIAQKKTEYQLQKQSELRAVEEQQQQKRYDLEQLEKLEKDKLQEIKELEVKQELTQHSLETMKNSESKQTKVSKASV